MDELLKYGGSGIVTLTKQLFSVVWHEEVVPVVPRQWRESLILNLFGIQGDITLRVL